MLEVVDEEEEDKEEQDSHFRSNSTVTKSTTKSQLIVSGHQHQEIQRKGNFFFLVIESLLYTNV